MTKPKTVTFTRVVSWRLSFRRSSDLTSTFVATNDDWEFLRSMAGTEVYLGEVAGKHSEVYYAVNLDDFEVMTEEPGEVAIVAKVLPNGTGFDILSRIRTHAEEHADDESEDADG